MRISAAGRRAASAPLAHLGGEGGRHASPAHKVAHALWVCEAPRGRQEKRNERRGANKGSRDRGRRGTHKRAARRGQGPLSGGETKRERGATLGRTERGIGWGVLLIWLAF